MMYRVADAPAPHLERPDDVLIRVAYTGICGSELHAIEGYRLVPGNDKGRPARSPLGHEYSGVVMAVGPEVRTTA